MMTASGNCSWCRALTCSQSSPEMGRSSTTQLTRWDILPSEKAVPRVLEGGMMEKGPGLRKRVDEKAKGETGCEEEKALGAEGGVGLR